MSTLQSYIEIHGGGPGSGCNPKVASPRCGRPETGRKKTPIKFKVSYVKGNKTYYLSKFENMNEWLYHARSLEEGKELVGQDRPPIQVQNPPRLVFTTDPDKALLVSRSAATAVDHILWKKGRSAEIIPVKLVTKKGTEREITRSRSKLGKAVQEQLKDKGALISMKDKGIKYHGTEATSRRVIEEKDIKVKVDGKNVKTTVTVVKPLGKNDVGTRRTGRNYNLPHSLNGRFSQHGIPVVIKSEGRTVWTYDAETGKAPGAGTTVMVHQLKPTKTKSQILVHELNREVWAEQYEQAEFKFKSGKPAKAFLYQRYGIKQFWSK